MSPESAQSIGKLLVSLVVIVAGYRLGKEYFKNKRNEHNEKNHERHSTL